MIKVEEAIKTVQELITPLSSEEVKLIESFDRVLAKNIYADCDIPGADNSAMDGYAVLCRIPREPLIIIPESWMWPEKSVRGLSLKEW